MIIKNLFFIFVFCLGIVGTYQLSAMKKVGVITEIKNNNINKTIKTFFEKSYNDFNYLLQTDALLYLLTIIKETNDNCYRGFVRKCALCIENKQIYVFGDEKSSRNVFSMLANMPIEKISVDKKMTLICFLMDVILELDKKNVNQALLNVKKSDFLKNITEKKDIFGSKNVDMCAFFFTVMSKNFVEMFFSEEDLSILSEYIKKDINKHLFCEFIAHHHLGLTYYNSEKKKTVLESILYSKLSAQDKISMLNYLTNLYVEMDAQIGIENKIFLFHVFRQSSHESDAVISTVGTVFRYLLSATKEEEKHAQEVSEGFLKILRSDTCKKYLWLFIIDAWRDVLLEKLTHSSKKTDELLTFITNKTTNKKKAKLDQKTWENECATPILSSIMQALSKKENEKALHYISLKCGVENIVKEWKEHVFVRDNGLSLTEIFTSDLSCKEIIDIIEKRYGNDIRLLENSMDLGFFLVLVKRDNLELFEYLVKKGISIRSFFDSDTSEFFALLRENKQYGVFDHFLEQAVKEGIILDSDIVQSYFNLLVKLAQADSENRKEYSHHVKRLTWLMQLSGTYFSGLRKSNFFTVKFVLEALELCGDAVRWREFAFSKLDKDAIKKVLNLSPKKSLKVGAKKLLEHIISTDNTQLFNEIMNTSVINKIHVMESQHPLLWDWLRECSPKFVIAVLSKIEKTDSALFKNEKKQLYSYIIRKYFNINELHEVVMSTDNLNEAKKIATKIMNLRYVVLFKTYKKIPQTQEEMNEFLFNRYESKYGIKYVATRLAIDRRLDDRESFKNFYKKIV